MPDPRSDLVARLLAMAVELETRAEAAFAAGRVAESVSLYERALGRREMARALASHPSTKREQSDTTREMTPAARARISQGRSRQSRGEAKPHPLIVAASSRGHTLRSLAAEVGTPASIISRALGGTRRIRRSAAQQIEALTGYAATAANWPGGWASE